MRTLTPGFNGNPNAVTTTATTTSDTNTITTPLAVQGERRTTSTQGAGKTSAKRTEAFLQFTTQHQRQCLTPDLRPINPTSLEGKLVIIAATGTNTEMNLALNGFLQDMGPAESLLLDEPLAEHLHSVRHRGFPAPDPFPEMDLADAAMDVLERSLEDALTSLDHERLPAQVPGIVVMGTDGLWKPILTAMKLLQNDRPGSAVRQAVAQIRSLLPDWKAGSLPAEVRKALAAVLQADEQRANAYMAANDVLERNKAAEMQSALDTLRESGGGGTVFSVMDSFTAERVRDRFAGLDDVVIVESRNFGKYRAQTREAGVEHFRIVNPPPRPGITTTTTTTTTTTAITAVVAEAGDASKKFAEDFVRFAAQHGRRCVTPALKPIVPASLDSKLVIIADVHDENQMHRALGKFFQGLRPGDRVLVEQGPIERALTVRYRGIDPGGRKPADAMYELLRSLYAAVELLALFKVSPPGRTTSMEAGLPWMRLHQSMLDLEGASEDLVGVAAATLRELLPDWNSADLPLEIRRGLADVVARDKTFAQIGADSWNSRNDNMTDEMRAEAERVHKAGTKGTVFAVIGQGHVECIRDRFAKDDDVILVERIDFDERSRKRFRTLSAAAMRLVPESPQARAEAFMRVVTEHNLQCVKPDLTPVKPDSLRGKLVIIADRFGDAKLHEALDGFLGGVWRSGFVLAEVNIAHELPSVKCNNFKLPGMTEERKAAISALTISLQRTLAALAKAGAGSAGAASNANALKDLHTRMSNALRQGADSLVVCHTVAAELRKLVPDWQDAALPEDARKGLGEAIEADKRQAVLGADHAVANDEQIELEMQAAFEVLRESKPGGTVFAVIGMAYVERARARFTADDDVLVVEMKQPGVTRKRMQNVSPAIFRVVPEPSGATRKS